MDEIENTIEQDVTANSPSGVDESTSAAAASGSDSTESNVLTSDAGQTTEQAADSAQQGDGLPTLEELQNQFSPKKETLIQFREAYDKLNADHRALKTQFEPIQPLLESRQVEEIQTALEIENNLFGQTVIDPQTNVPRPDTSKFLDYVAEKDPNTLDYLESDLLTRPGASGESRIREVIRSFGLDPDLLAKGEYVHKDLVSSDSSQSLQGLSERDAENLADIPKEFHDAYKSLSEAEKQDFGYMNENTQKSLLDRAKRDVDYRNQQAQMERQAEAQFQQDVQTNFVSRINSYRETAFNSITNQIAESIKVSADETYNKFEAAGTTAMLFHLLDTDPNNKVYRDMAISQLSVAGVQFGEAEASKLDGILSTLEQNSREAESLRAYSERLKSQGNVRDAESYRQRAEAKQTAADSAQRQMLGIGLSYAKKMQAYKAGQVNQIRTAVNSKIESAHTARPVVTGNGNLEHQSQTMPSISSPEGLKAWQERIRARQSQ